MKVRDLLRDMQLAAATRLVEVPEEGSAEWLDVKLPVSEAISA